MKKLISLATVLTTLAALAGASVALADKVYHTERLPFSLTAAGAEAGHPELRSGQVVNIHPNGPQIGAIERYMLNGAKPRTTYDIVLTAYTECDGDIAGEDFPLKTAELTTGPSGNGKASFVFTFDDLAPFSGAVVGVQWTAEVDGVVIYETPCTTVTID